MNFCEALKAMQMGSKVSREAWRGRISYWDKFVSKDGVNYIRQVKPNSESILLEAISLEEIYADDWWVVT